MAVQLASDMSCCVLCCPGSSVAIKDGKQVGVGYGRVQWGGHAARILHAVIPSLP